MRPVRNLSVLREASKSAGNVQKLGNGRVRIKIIEPGQGATGFYTPEVLDQTAKAGLFDNVPIMKNHPGTGQRTEKPDVDMTVGFIEPGTASYMQNGPKGPGVYAVATVLGPERSKVYSFVDTPFGMSIHADGQLEREGDVTSRVMRIDKVHSVDLVVRPGAGGAIVGVLESATLRRASSRNSYPLVEQNIVEEGAMPGMRIGTIVEDENGVEYAYLGNVQEMSYNRGRSAGRMREAARNNRQDEEDDDQIFEDENGDRYLMLNPNDDDLEEEEFTERFGSVARMAQRGRGAAGRAAGRAAGAARGAASGARRLGRAGMAGARGQGRNYGPGAGRQIYQGARRVRGVAQSAVARGRGAASRAAGTVRGNPRRAAAIGAGAAGAAALGAGGAAAMSRRKEEELDEERIIQYENGDQFFFEDDDSFTYLGNIYEDDEEGEGQQQQQRGRNQRGQQGEGEEGEEEGIQEALADIYEQLDHLTHGDNRANRLMEMANQNTRGSYESRRLIEAAALEFCDTPAEARKFGRLFGQAIELDRAARGANWANNERIGWGQEPVGAGTRQSNLREQRGGQQRQPEVGGDGAWGSNGGNGNLRESESSIGMSEAEIDEMISSVFA